MEARSRRREEKCEMNFRNNLTAFSWKPLKLTVGKRGLPIPSSLRSSAAAERRRWAEQTRMMYDDSKNC
jgi:hypothetical protein